MTDHFVGVHFPSNGRLRSNAAECLPTISPKGARGLRQYLQGISDPDQVEHLFVIPLLAGLKT